MDLNLYDCDNIFLFFYIYFSVILGFYLFSEVENDQVSCHCLQPVWLSLRGAVKAIIKINIWDNYQLRLQQELAAILEISNDDISGMGLINFMFHSRVEFSGTADRMDLLPVAPNPRWRPVTNYHISGMGYPIHFHELDSSFGGI